jgi:diguanylate cyclase (GGDEF)-like protein
MHSELIQENVMGIGKGISGWVAAFRTPMMNASPALDFPDNKSDLAFFNDALVVPIIYEDESFGTISLYASEPSTYGRYELNILQTMASLLAPLISASQEYTVPASEKILDSTTGIHRISYLSAVSPQLITLAEKNKFPVSLIYLEIRNLSQLIRLYGANIGNLALKRIADCIQPELRATDILVRFGHQGFVALLPGVREEQALHCVQRLKLQIRSQGAMAGGQNFPIDCQAGVAAYPRDGVSVFALLQSAQKNIGTFAEESIPQDGNVVGFPPRT